MARNEKTQVRLFCKELPVLITCLERTASVDFIPYTYHTSSGRFGTLKLTTMIVTSASRMSREIGYPGVIELFRGDRKRNISIEIVIV